MPSSYSPRSRLNLQATGENLNLWGQILNAGGLELIDAAMDGVTIISTPGATTLTTANGAADQARSRVLNVTASAAAQITIPSVEKFYIVRAALADVTITNGSNSLVVKAGDLCAVITDGVGVWQVRSTDFGGSRVKNIGAPVAQTDAVTKKYVDDSALGGVANFPGLTSNRSRALRVNAAQTNAEWEPDEITVTANYTAAVGDRIVADTSGGTFTVTLPASPAEGDQVWIRDGGNTATAQGWRVNPLTINPNGSTVRGDADATTSLNIKGVRVTFIYHSGSWSVTIG